MSDQLRRRLGYKPWTEFSQNEQAEIKSEMIIQGFKDGDLDWLPDYWWIREGATWSCTNPNPPLF